MIDLTVQRSNLSIVLQIAGGADGVEDAVVDDGVDSEGDRVGGEDLLGRDLEHPGPRVDSPDLKDKSMVLVSRII